MEYQAGVLIHSFEEEGFGDYHWASEFVPLRPTRESLDEVVADLPAVRFWIRKQQREYARFQKRHGPLYRGDSWNWGRSRREDASFEVPVVPDPSYEVFIRVCQDS